MKEQKENKKKMPSSGFWRSDELQTGNQRQILGSCQKAKKAVEHVSDSDTNCSWFTWNSLQKIGKGIRTIGNQWKNRNHQETIVEIDQNTQTNPGELRRLSVTQTPVKDYQ